MDKLFWAEIGLLMIVLVGYPLAVWCIRGRRENQEWKQDRAMFLPRGTVRAMLALIVVASFVNVLVLGSKIPHFDQVLAAFGALTGSVIGFYFGTRSAQQSPENEKPPGGLPTGVAGSVPSTGGAP